MRPQSLNIRCPARMERVYGCVWVATVAYPADRVCLFFSPPCTCMSWVHRRYNAAPSSISRFGAFGFRASCHAAPPSVSHRGGGARGGPSDDPLLWDQQEIWTSHIQRGRGAESVDRLMPPGGGGSRPPARFPVCWVHRYEFSSSRSMRKSEYDDLRARQALSPSGSALSTPRPHRTLDPRFSATQPDVRQVSTSVQGLLTDPDRPCPDVPFSIWLRSGKFWGGWAKFDHRSRSVDPHQGLEQPNGSPPRYP